MLAEKTDRYNVFAADFVGYVEAMIQELQDEHLSKLGLKVVVDKDYNFGNNKWFAAYQHANGSIGNGIIKIALNLPYIYGVMKGKGVEKDSFNLEAQARITVGHEIGHGIVDYLLNVYDGGCESADDIVRDYYDGELNEEALVEEFGDSMFPEATGVWGSTLSSVLSDIANAKSRPKQPVE